MENHASLHVFLSFKGETRNKFTCFLYKALKEEGFVAFMDKNDIRVGDEVHSKILEGIRVSMGSIIIFSQNYAYSPWCLDELVLILKRLKNSRYFIIPIYYEVENKDIKHQLGNYGDALEKHRARHSDKIEKWRQALREVGSILGHNVEGPQTIFIQNTVNLVREKLAATFPDFHLPAPEKSVNPSSSYKLRRNRVFLYTTSINNFPCANDSVKRVLKSGNVVYETKDCAKKPEYLRELEELVGKDNVRFPMVIVNGKDLCGDEDVEGLDDINKKELIKLLGTLYASEKTNDESQEMSYPNKVIHYFSAGIVSYVGVRITNRLSNTVAAHARSADTDIGEQQINPDQSMQWEFRRNLFGRTLFWCDFRDGSRGQGVVVYEETTGLRPDNGDNSMLCYWEVRDEGFYFSPGPSTLFVKIHDWCQK